MTYQGIEFDEQRVPSRRSRARRETRSSGLAGWLLRISKGRITTLSQANTILFFAGLALRLLAIVSLIMSRDTIKPVPLEQIPLDQREGELARRGL